MFAKNRSTTAYGALTPRVGFTSTCTVRFELGQANNGELPDPSSAYEGTQPAIAMTGRVSGSMLVAVAGRR